MCIILGCPTPMMLRPMGDDYVLIGEACFHGIMFGEALQDLEDGVSGIEEFGGKELYHQERRCMLNSTLHHASKADYLVVQSYVQLFAPTYINRQRFQLPLKPQVSLPPHEPPPANFAKISIGNASARA